MLGKILSLILFSLSGFSLIKFQSSITVVSYRLSAQSHSFVWLLSVKSLSKFESFGNPSKEKNRKKSPLSFPGDSDGKEFVCNLGDLGSVPRLGRSPGGGHGNPRRQSCLENPTDRGDWWATVHGVAKSWTRLSDFTLLLQPKTILTMRHWTRQSRDQKTEET